jgi:hypothetical protein
MSYDLLFRPGPFAVTPEAFFAHFEGRAHYTVQNDQAWYQNEDSGVYFVFEHNAPDADGGDEPHHPFAFNINFFRPSYFILEAEPEVTALVERFQFQVEDAQIDGMGDGPYQPHLLVSGWNRGNEFGYAALRAEADRPDFASLPRRRLHDVWRWNRGRASLQEQVGDAQFVPKIMFLRLDGEVVTAVAWPDAIPSVLPRVDYLIIGREQLAPRSFFRKTKDTTFVRWGEAETLIARFDSGRREGAFDLNYGECPEEMAQFVRRLVRHEPAMTGVPADQVLDREIVETSGQA